MGELKIKNVADLAAFERVPIEERMTSFNTFDMLKNGVAINPDATAISFFFVRRPIRPTNGGNISGFYVSDNRHCQPLS